jgi:phosphoenolpyruvate-protein phosphotransferase/dihydroxyacetone kinase phosphotransfer subunit
MAMIGLVIVAHSRALALALRDLARQVSSEETAIAIAAGTGPDKSEFGTDALEISEAIQSVYSPDGVLILMDLGSAVLSAQVAIELLPPEFQANVQFCSAPLVEGAIAASVQASLGSDLETACREAQQALLPKKEQLGETAEMPSYSLAQDEVVLGSGAPCVHLVLHNTYGLHARPAARFVQMAGKYTAEIQVKNLTNGKGPVTAKSLNALATLGAVQNHQIEICASGPQAQEALQALSGMVEENFGEGTEPPPSKPAPEISQPKQIEGALNGIPIAEGIAVAPIARYEAPPPPVPQDPGQGFEHEWSRLQTALEVVRKSIGEQYLRVSASLGREQAAIFEAHLLILDDPEIQDGVRKEIENSGMNAAAAWQKIIENTAAQYEALEDPYLQQRATDVRDVGNQVLHALAGQTKQVEIRFDHPVILVANELTPTQTTQLDLAQVQGLVTVVGGPTSHSAILARSLGIPAISGISASILKLADGTPAGLDGNRGALWVRPSDEIRKTLEAERANWLTQRKELMEQSRQQGRTKDGKRVEIVANVGNLPDTEAAAKNGAEGIGLLRTEFLFLTRTDPPTEDEQYEALRKIVQVMDNLPVIVRTLDVGGDKPLPYVDLPIEANPFLGVRAIRLSFQRPDLFNTQLRAILRAGAHGNVKVMFPMVSGVEEIQKARHMLVEIHQDLESQGIDHQWPLETGIMVEIPSAAILAPVLAPVVDFFSIGTNDLTQYTLAAERGNASLAELSDALHPAVLRLIQQVAQGAHAHGKWVGICGELGGDPAAAPILVGLGVDELSMNPGSIPKVKSILRSITHSQAQELANQALALGTTAEIRELAASFLKTNIDS